VEVREGPRHVVRLDPRLDLGPPAPGRPDPDLRRSCQLPHRILEHGGHQTLLGRALGAPDELRRQERGEPRDPRVPRPTRPSRLPLHGLLLVPRPRAPARFLSNSCLPKAARAVNDSLLRRPTFYSAPEHLATRCGTSNGGVITTERGRPQPFAQRPERVRRNGCPFDVFRNGRISTAEDGSPLTLPCAGCQRGVVCYQPQSRGKEPC